MLSFVDGLLIVGGLMIMKGVVEPASAYWGERLTRKYLPLLFKRLDPILPSYLFWENEMDLSEFVMNQILRLEIEEKVYLTQHDRDKLLIAWDKKYSPIIHSQKIQSKEIPVIGNPDLYD